MLQDFLFQQTFIKVACCIQVRLRWSCRYRWRFRRRWGGKGGLFHGRSCDDCGWRCALRFALCRWRFGNRFRSRGWLRCGLWPWFWDFFFGWRRRGRRGRRFRFWLRLWFRLRRSRHRDWLRLHQFDHQYFRLFQFFPAKIRDKQRCRDMQPNGQYECPYKHGIAETAGMGMGCQGRIIWLNNAVSRKMQSADYTISCSAASRAYCCCDVMTKRCSSYSHSSFG